jgi:hypothetical protein
VSPPAELLFLTPRAVRYWRIAQVAVWLVGAGIFLALVFRPVLGLHAFWNVLIPVAPALLAVAPGLWRNVCPLGSTALFPRHMGWSKRKRISAEWQGRMLLIGVALLLLIVPLRHVVMDLSGPATALAIGLLAVVAVTVGFHFEWKSGWCSGLCPVHPVEKLYGTQSAISPPNAHCDMCHQCVAPCPDSTPSVHPLMVEKPASRKIAGTLLVGGFAGYVWGWFQVPDWSGGEGWSHLGQAYAWPLGGLAGAVVVFLLLQRLVPRRHRRTLIVAFAAAAIACYYWVRLPMLFGFAPHPGDGALVDMRETLPAWFPWACRATTTALLVGWFLARTGVRRAWGLRPEYA